MDYKLGSDLLGLIWESLGEQAFDGEKTIIEPAMPIPFEGGAGALEELISREYANAISDFGMLNFMAAVYCVNHQIFRHL